MNTQTANGEQLLSSGRAQKFIAEKKKKERKKKREKELEQNNLMLHN